MKYRSEGYEGRSELLPLKRCLEFARANKQKFINREDSSYILYLGEIQAFAANYGNNGTTEYEKKVCKKFCKDHNMKWKEPYEL